MTTQNIAIVIPALNEEEALRQLLPELSAAPHPSQGTRKGCPYHDTTRTNDPSVVMAGALPDHDTTRTNGPSVVMAGALADHDTTRTNGPSVVMVGASLAGALGVGGRVRWIIVVDNNSTDATAAVARAAGAVVVSESLRGYGQACWQGFQRARQLGADIVVFMDGDGSDDPADLPLMLAPLLNGKADLVIGSRVSKRAEAGAIPPQARLGNWLVSRLISQLYGVRLHDVGSFRVIKCTTLEALQMRERTFGWPVEMLVKAARARYRIVEVPIHYRHRSHGRSKVAGTLAGSVKAAYYMLSTTLRYAGIRRKYV